MQYPAAFQIFGVPVETHSKKDRSRSVIRQCQSGKPNVGAVARETIMMDIGHHDLHTRSNGVKREIHNL